MATSVNMNGKGTGRKGSTVYKIIHGVQVQQEYNPHVSNPNTTKQQNTRSRFKLMSQLAAAMAPYAVYKREGLTSPRNVFIRENFKNTVAEEGNSAAAIMNFQLAKGVMQGVSDAEIIRNNDKFHVNTGKLDNSDAMMCVIFVREKDGSLAPHASGIMQILPNNPSAVTFEAPVSNKEAFAYIYGMKFNNAADKSKYEDYIVGNATEVATLIKENIITASNMTYTKTYATRVESLEDVTYNIQVYSQNPNAGTVAMSRNQETGMVTLTATPRTGYLFSGWRKSGSQDVASIANPYSFLPLKDDTFWGIFINQSPEA